MEEINEVMNKDYFDDQEQGPKQITAYALCWNHHDQYTEDDGETVEVFCTEQQAVAAWKASQGRVHQDTKPIELPRPYRSAIVAKVISMEMQEKAQTTNDIPVLATFNMLESSRTYCPGSEILGIYQTTSCPRII